MATVARWPPPLWLKECTAVCSGLMAGMASLFVVSLIGRAFERRENHSYFLVSISSLWIALTPIVILSYSSRYTALGVPAFVLMAEDYAPATLARGAWMFLGMALGVMSLFSYLSQQGWVLPRSEVNQASLDLRYIRVSRQTRRLQG